MSCPPTNYQKLRLKFGRHRLGVGREVDPGDLGGLPLTVRSGTERSFWG